MIVFMANDSSFNTEIAEEEENYEARMAKICELHFHVIPFRVLRVSVLIFPF
jgi:hypothetical protein